MNAHLPHPAPHTAIKIDDGAVEIDASIVAAGLGLEPQEVLSLMRAKAITSIRRVDGQSHPHWRGDVR